MPIEYVPSEKGITAHYANGVKLVLDFLETPFGDRPGWINELGTCPVRFEGDEGWVETGDNGGIVVQPDLAPGRTRQDPLRKPRAAASTSAPTPATSSSCIKSRQPTAANPEIMKRSHIACHAAALSWILKRKLRLDPETFTFLDDDEANSLRIPHPPAKPWRRVDIHSAPRKRGSCSCSTASAANLVPLAERAGAAADDPRTTSSAPPSPTTIGIPVGRSVIVGIARTTRPRQHPQPKPLRDRRQQQHRLHLRELIPNAHPGPAAKRKIRVPVQPLRQPIQPALGPELLGLVKPPPIALDDPLAQPHRMPPRQQISA